MAANVAKLGQLTGKVPGDTVSIEHLIRKHGLNKPYAFYDRKMKQLAESGKKIQDFWNEQANKGWEAPNPDIVETRWRDRPISKSVSAISSGITSIGVVVGTTALTKSPNAGLALLAASEAGSIYGRLRDEDVPIGVASKLSLLAGAWTMATEKIGFDKLLKPGARTAINAFKKSGWEGAQEVVEGMGHNLLEYFGYDYRKPSDIPTAVKASYDHVMDNFMDNLVGGMGAGGAVSLVTGRPTKGKDGPLAVKPPTVEELTGKSIKEIEAQQSAEKEKVEKELTDKLLQEYSNVELDSSLTPQESIGFDIHKEAPYFKVGTKGGTSEEILAATLHEINHLEEGIREEYLSLGEKDGLEISVWQSSIEMAQEMGFNMTPELIAKIQPRIAKYIKLLRFPTPAQAKAEAQQSAEKEITTVEGIYLERIRNGQAPTRGKGKPVGEADLSVAADLLDVNYETYFEDGKKVWEINGEKFNTKKETFNRFIELAQPTQAKAEVTPTEIPEGIMAREPYKLKKNEPPITDEQRKSLRDNGYSIEQIVRLSPKEAKAVVAGHTLAVAPDGSAITPATLVVDQLKTLPRTQPTEGERRRMSSYMQVYTTGREKVSNYILNQDIMLKFFEMLDGYDTNGPMRKFIFDPIKNANIRTRDNITKVMDGFKDTFDEQGISLGDMAINKRADVVPGFPLTDTQRMGMYMVAKQENGRRRVESWFDKENIDNAKAVDLVIASVEASDQEMAVVATVESYRDVMSPRFFDAATEMGFKDVKHEADYLTLFTEDQDEILQSPVVEQLASFTGGKVKTPGERSVKERTGTTARARIDLIDIFPAMVRSMERFIEVGPIAAKVGRSMDNPAFRAALNNATRGQGYKVARSWLEDSTRGSANRGNSYWSEWIRNRRRNAVPYLLGHKIFTVVPKQTVSITNTIAKRPVLAPAIMGKVAAYADPRVLKADRARANELSSMMRNRDWHRDLTRLYDKKDMIKFFKGKRLSPISMASTTHADNVAVTACWLSAHEQAMIDLNGDDKASVRYADDLITEGHPMGSVEDMAGFFRGGALEQMVTTFMNQPNKNWNFLRHEIYNKLRAGKISKREAMQRFMIGQILPALILGTITRGRLPESPEEIAKDIASHMLGGLVFFGRWVYNVVTGDWDPIKSAFSTVPFKALEEVGRTVGSAKRGDVQKTVEHAVGTVGAYTGKIPQQIITTTGGMIDLMQGETDDYKRLIYSEYMLKRNKPESGTTRRSRKAPTRRRTPG